MRIFLLTQVFDKIDFFFNDLERNNILKTIQFLL